MAKAKEPPTGGSPLWSHTSKRSSRNKRVRRTARWSVWRTIGGVLLVVALVVGVFMVLSHQSAENGAVATPVSVSVLRAVSHVNPSVLTAVGRGGAQNMPRALQGQPALTGPTGKSEFFYAGAQYCPYCAAQRWAIVVALSRFGAFSQLAQTTSAPDDTDPSTPTLTFHHSSYSSAYIDFVPVELQSNQRDTTGNYASLETPTAQQQHLLDTYDEPPYVSQNAQGGIPFIDIANQFIVAGPGYDSQLLSGLSWDQIAKDVSDASSLVTQGIVGTANTLTAAICSTTHQQPEGVCKAAPLPQLHQSLGLATARTQARHLELAMNRSQHGREKT